MITIPPRSEFEVPVVPRDEMPQIDEADYPALLDFLTANGIGWRHRFIADPNDLRSRQKIDMNYVNNMSDDTLSKPVLVSDELVICDGNHRWMAHVLLKSSIQSIEIELDFSAAIEMLFRFPKTYSYGDGKDHTFTP